MTTSLGPDVIEHVIGKAGELVVRLPAGQVELRGTDGETVRLREVDGEPLDDRFQIDREPSLLSFRVRDGVHLGGLLRGVFRPSHARLAVELPRGAVVTIEGASTDIVGDGLKGKQRYRSASGSIRLTRVTGTVTVESVSGDISVEPDGVLELAGRSVSGDIGVHGGRLPTMVLASTSGDIEVDAVLGGPGPYGIQTVSGDAVVHAHGGLKVEAKTVTGSVASRAPHRSEGRRGQHDIVVGDGRVLLTFKSISGDLRIADRSAASGAAGLAAPVAPAPPVAPGAPVPPLAPAPPAEPDAHETQRLAILRDLESGAIDVAEAGARLAALEGDSDG